uniref:Uncharacterized protein n=1 Tax=Arundo donax TaxID=35708 RepID=A0A0A9ASK8_ARUDO
MLGAVGIDLTG